MVHYWMHNNMITINGQKMGKSLGNFITLEEFFTGSNKILSQAYTPMTIRFFILQAHYRSTVDFSNEALQAAEKVLTAIQALCPCQEEVPCQPLRRGQADRLLEEMGAPERLQGRRWLAVAAETMAAAGRPILLKEAYYPAVHLSASTYAAVDKNIRDVIRRIHDTGSPAYYAVMGGVPDRCPSNGVFLRCLAHELRRRADSAG